MKKIKKMLLVLAAFAMCVIPVLSTPLESKAAPATGYTYIAKYVPVTGHWKFQVGEWKADGYLHDMYLLNEYMKDGDHLVIDGTEKLELNVDVQLGSLTIVQCPIAVIYLKGVDNFYSLKDSTAAINADVTNAYVYDFSSINFNKNVSYLEIIREGADNLEATVRVLGTVGHAKAYDKSKTYFEWYDFAENSFYSVKNSLHTDPSLRSATPSTTAPVTTPSTTPSGEYDAVPKTGDVRFNPLWLVGLAGVCLAGSYVVKKKVNA